MMYCEEYFKLPFALAVNKKKGSLASKVFRSSRGIISENETKYVKGLSEPFLLQDIPKIRTAAIRPQLNQSWKQLLLGKKLFVVRTSTIRKIPKMLFMCYWQKSILL